MVIRVYNTKNLFNKKLVLGLFRCIPLTKYRNFRAPTEGQRHSRKSEKEREREGKRKGRREREGGRRTEKTKGQREEKKKNGKKIHFFGHKTGHRKRY